MSQEDVLLALASIALLIFGGLLEARCILRHIC